MVFEIVSLFSKILDLINKIENVSCTHSTKLISFDIKDLFTSILISDLKGKKKLQKMCNEKL